MSERDDAIEDLRANQVLAGIAWAWVSTLQQTLGSYDPETGHGQGWLGYNAFVVLTDRLDRVFSLGRFALEPNLDPALGTDWLAQGLADREYERMPQMQPDVVIRDDLNGSPGWRCSGWRILLQSFGGLDIDRIPWSQKSWTKRRVAAQPTPDEPMLPFEVLPVPMAMDVLGDLSGQPPVDRPIVTLVGTYSIDAVTLESAFYIGHPRLNYRGDDAWHWKFRLDADGYDGNERGRPTATPGDSPVSPVPDAPVRLRPAAKEEKSNPQGNV